jgi:hypothetical protein
VNKSAKEKKPSVVKMGGIIGPIDTFNTEEGSPELVVTYNALIASGTVLRIKFTDFYRAKYGDKVAESMQRPVESEEDKLVRQVNYHGLKYLTTHMHQFLRKNNLLSSSASDSGFKYICSGNIGRCLPARSKESDVLVILNGAVRVTLEKSIFPAINEGIASSHVGGSKEEAVSDDEENEYDIPRGGPGSITCMREGQPQLNYQVCLCG